MTREKVDKMLTEYREHHARCEHLRNDISDAERLLEEMRGRMLIDNICITTKYRDTPSGKGISDPTGRLAQLLADGGKTDHIRQLEGDIKAMRREMTDSETCVKFVDAWMLALGKKERFVMEEKVKQGASWRQLVISFHRVFGEAYTVEGLKSICRSAMDTIYRIAK